MAKLILGGILATVLLALYAVAIGIGITRTAHCGVTSEEARHIAAGNSNSTDTNTSKTRTEWRIDEKCDNNEKSLDNLSYLLNLLGALISATVVAGLAATKPNELPGKDIFKAGFGEFGQSITAYLPLVYILVWTICGASVVVYALMIFVNDPSPPLTALAKAWLGTAVAAIYAYFGITPNGTAVRPAIANITIAPDALTLNSTDQPVKLTVTATDDQDNPIPDISNDLFNWETSKPDVATVDSAGVVTRQSAGNDCKITATANGKTSNECTVTCS